jgi:hypothetical protein
LLLIGLFSLAFTTPPANALSLQQQITRWIVLQKARRHRINRLRLLVRTQFQDLFHSPSGVLLTFPSRYLYTIDRKIYLALGGGPPGFSQGFTCPDLLDSTDDKLHPFAYLAFTVFGATFQRLLLTMQFVTYWKLVLASPTSCRQLIRRSVSHKRLSVCHNPLITFV